MIRYVVKRILQFIPVALLVAFLIFTIMYFVPGDPARVVAGEMATEEQLQIVRENLGLNQPYIVRLGTFMRDVFLRFDFGTSYITGVKISEELLRRLPRTLILGLSSWIIGVLVGVPLGITAGVNQNKFSDRFCMVLALFGVSMPQFWLGLMLVLLFSVKLGWFPASGLGTPLHYVLPAIAGSFNGLASNARQARSAMLEVIRSDYITTARAKGISRNKVIYKHALPNALFPILTTSSVGLAHICGGSVVIETVFGIPGVGMYMMTAVNARDYPIVQACVVILAVIFAAVMLVVDLLYAFIDPKIKSKYVGSGRKKGSAKTNG